MELNRPQTRSYTNNQLKPNSVSNDQDSMMAQQPNYSHDLIQLNTDEAVGGLSTSSPQAHCSHDPLHTDTGDKASVSSRRSSHTPLQVNKATDDRVSVTSRRSHSHSHGSRVSSVSRASSSSVMRDARVAAAASKTALEFEHKLANKRKEHDVELAHKKVQAELELAAKTAECELQMVQKKAEADRELAILAATKTAAIDQAKLVAIEQCIEEEEIGRGDSEERNSRCSRLRTEEWVQSHDELGHTVDQDGQLLPNEDIHLLDEPLQPQPTLPNNLCLPLNTVTTDAVGRQSSKPYENNVAAIGTENNCGSSKANDSCEVSIHARNEDIAGTSPAKIVQKDSLWTNTLRSSSKIEGFAGNPPVFVPRQSTQHDSTDLTSNTSLAVVSRQLAANLARQNLPKFEPDFFDGDVTLYYPWKACFQNMLQDAQVSPAHELTLLRKYTKGEPQKNVDCYRKRLYRNPQDAIRDVWQCLDAKFGNTAAVAHAYMEQLDKAARFGEHDLTKLQDMASVCSDIKCQAEYLPSLSCLNFATVLQPIINKLPRYLRQKWEKIVIEYSNANDNTYPPFEKFASFIANQADIKTHPNIQVGKNSKPRESSCDPESPTGRREHKLRVFKSETSRPSPRNPDLFCPIHELDGHSLVECRIFERKTWQDKTDIVKKAGLCFRCLNAKHPSSECKETVKCGTCGSEKHRTQFHMESKSPRTNTEGIHSMCTTVCDGKIGGYSCSKMLLVDVHPANHPDRVRRVYAIVDDQSNASLISPQLIDDLGMDGAKEAYTLSTCSGERTTKYGRRISDLVLSSPSGSQIGLPTCIECEHIPTDKTEIATPDIARQFSHLRQIADELSDVDHDAPVSLLIGRNAPEVLKVRSFINGPTGAPWAQKLALGWTISGQVCLDRTSGAIHVIARKTTAVTKDTETDYATTPCPNHIDVHVEDVFKSTSDDNNIGLSHEDRRFLSVMDESYHKNDENFCEMPLPFRDSITTMPSNRSQAEKRLISLRNSFQKKPNMKADYVEFMKKIFDKKHASVLSNRRITENTNETGKMWYLPHFGVYHPKKPTKIRVVFDASAEYKGVSLNKVLVSGPDQMNSLIGVLIRFRKEKVALMCDVEQMFHSFYVNAEHRDFLRFLWFRDHDPNGDIIECNMNVHIFGNVSSPAVATYGMRRTADEGREKYGKEARDFVHEDFYVDDGLTSCPSESDAIALIKNTQEMLRESNLRLHKVASNSVVVMNSLAEEDRAQGISELDLRTDVLPSIRSLGVYWNMETDSFGFKVNIPDKPFSRRGLLSVVNSVYDPLGIAAPVISTGKIILQQANAACNDNTTSKISWDDPLPEEMRKRWNVWKGDLAQLENISVPRCYHSDVFGNLKRTEIHTFSDASKDAIGVAIYLRQSDSGGEVNTSLAFGQAKVAPIRLTTIPRLELCAAVLATQATQKFVKELHRPIDAEYYYTDSKIVLGYIQNDSRRFHVYVANRVQCIRNLTNPSQWRYIDTCENPADIATRGIHATKLTTSLWIQGPSFLKETQNEESRQEQIPLRDDDPDVKKGLTVHNINVTTTTQNLGSSRFRRFSTWSSAVRAIANLIALAKKYARRRDNTGNDEATRVTNATSFCTPTSAQLEHAERIIVRTVQREEFQHECDILSGPNVNYATDLKSSTLYKLDPVLDDDGILRVGGRLRRSELDYNEKHPIILPKHHHISRLIIEHYHQQVHHQGRLLTHGAIRTAGIWIIGGQTKVSQTISNCVTCRRLRGKPVTQKMADLPADRLECSPPFTNVGFDVFGPWKLTTKKLRGGAFESKRWAIIFTCLSSHAIHLEMLESMDSSSFICALRRFFALRGAASVLRCDRGSNFVGGKTELEESLAEIDGQSIERFTAEHGCQWIFNPPHASHFGGVWERQIGTVRRILDSMFLELGYGQLTQEILTTFLAEVTGIVNSRPITAITADKDEPTPLTPSMLLTMKTRPYAPLLGHFVPQDLYARRRWRRIQYLADQFWVRWRREYIQNLQSREVWQTPRRNLRVNDVVILNDDSVPRYMWPLGRITETYPSDDGHVRKAKVDTYKDGQVKSYIRPVKDFVVLIEYAD